MICLGVGGGSAATCGSTATVAFKASLGQFPDQLICLLMVQARRPRPCDEVSPIRRIHECDTKATRAPKTELAPADATCDPGGAEPASYRTLRLLHSHSAARPRLPPRCFGFSSCKLARQIRTCGGGLQPRIALASPHPTSKTRSRTKGLFRALCG